MAQGSSNNITKWSEYASYHFYDQTRNEKRPCERISYLHYEKNLESFSRYWRIDIQYPKDVKIIIQTKEVDVHALIGNIGGYIGLFLGKITTVYHLTMINKIGMIYTNFY